ncbi:MAG: diaminopimelate epimerase [Acidobacteria bacterium]|nr:MAG: diaminopimelate epimerase [Acidobacteriota bacterium]
MMASSAAIPFTKASACGNDFLLIDGMHAPADLAAFSRRICDRHRGVGADGVEWLFPAQDADIRARLFNADGSEAEISGNGTRCVAAYLSAEQARDKVVVRTGAGLKTCTLRSRNGSSYEFEIAMGEPQVGDEFPIKLAFREVRGIPVSMGNPHYVVFVNDFAPGWQAEAAEIGRHHGTRSRRNAILRYRVVCCRGRFDGCEKGGISGLCAHARWGAKRAMGRTSVLGRRGATYLPGRVFKLKCWFKTVI